MKRSSVSCLPNTTTLFYSSSKEPLIVLFMLILVCMKCCVKNTFNVAIFGMKYSPSFCFQNLLVQCSLTWILLNSVDERLIEVAERWSSELSTQTAFEYRRSPRVSHCLWTVKLENENTQKYVECGEPKCLFLRSQSRPPINSLFLTDPQRNPRQMHCTLLPPSGASGHIVRHTGDVIERYHYYHPKSNACVSKTSSHETLVTFIH